MGLALALSLIAHTLVVSLIARPGGDRNGGALPAAPLVARLANPPKPAMRAETRPTSAVPAAQRTAPQPTPRPPEPTPDDPPTRAPIASQPDAPTEIPADYLPLSGLSREPELVTDVPADIWPPLPDAPTGVFQLELAIGPDGAVDLVVPRCDPALCPAANTYAEIVRQWHFQPAEILGRPVPSRLKLEFELGDPAAASDQAPRQ